MVHQDLATSNICLKQVCMEDVVLKETFIMKSHQDAYFKLEF